MDQKMRSTAKGLQAVEPLGRLAAFGGAGDPFDDAETDGALLQYQPLTRIVVRHGEILDSLQAVYDGAALTPHGGDGGTVTSLDLTAGDPVIAIDGYYGTWWDRTFIKQVSFRTLTGKVLGPFGSNRYPECSTPFSLEAPGDEKIAGFYGATAVHPASGNRYVCQLGAFTRPRADDPFVVRYCQYRKTLKTQFYDPVFTEAVRQEIGWSSEEERVNDELQRLKELVVTSGDYHAAPWETRYFIDVKGRIEQTGLFKFLKAMPKGAILHIHPSAMGDYAALLDAAAAFVEQGQRFYIAAGYKEFDRNQSKVDGKDFFRLADSPPPGYLPLAQEWRSSRQDVLDVVTLVDDDLAYAGDVWDRFQPFFSRVGPLQRPAALGAAYYKNALWYLAAEDNLVHVELRTSWKEENEANPSSKEGQILGALAAIRADYPYFTMKVIYSDSRQSSPSQQIEDDIVRVGKALKGGPGHVVGYDLVGEEDTGGTSYRYLGDVANAFEKLEGFLPPFFFHDGESDLPPDYHTPESPDEIPAKVYFNNNLLDAFLFNTMQLGEFRCSPARVGHGIELYKTPKLLADYIDAGISVELCPVSNQLLKYMVDIREHPGQGYLASGLPVSLSPDDPAIYGYQGVSHDFWLACIGWDLDLKMLKLLSYYSLQHSALQGTERSAAIAQWKTMWDAFICAQRPAV